MQDKIMQKKALETVCYVAGAGAFSVFFRWLQTMLAYNDEGLVDKSAFNFLVPAILIAAALMFRSFVKKFEKERYYIGEDFFEVMRNDGKFFGALRWVIGILMLAGSALLLAECEVDREAKFLRILSLLGIAGGFSFPLLLTCANKPHVSKQNTCCLLAAIPIIMFSFWLVTSYKINSINPVLWDYALEVITIIICILSFFRLAGFEFSNPNPKRAFFLAMLGSAMCIMIVADERYMGMQLMYLSAAAMQLYYVWIMIINMSRKEEKPNVQPNDGFERL